MSWHYYCDSCDKSDVTEYKYCIKCDFCKDCCVCSRPKFFNSKLTFHKPTRNQKKINKSDRFISAEIEVAKIKTNKKLVEDVIAKWNGSIVYDGTLPQGGFEINTAPAAGDLYVKQINEICTNLELAEAKTSNQCGLHVHLDARDYNYCDLRRLIKVYAAIEPALFSMIPAHRHNSIYAIKCANALENAVKQEKVQHITLKHSIVTAIYGTGNSAYRTHKRGAGHGTGRYYALNLHSWFHRGTIECRMFDGTLDKKEIIDWGVLWANILDFALHSSDDEVSTAMNKKKSLESLIHIVEDNQELKSFINARYELHVQKKKDKPLVSASSYWQLGSIFAD